VKPQNDLLKARIADKKHDTLTEAIKKFQVCELLHSIVSVSLYLNMGGGAMPTIYDQSQFGHIKVPLSLLAESPSSGRIFCRPAED
jgi:hypothetical protein